MIKKESIKKGKIVNGWRVERIKHIKEEKQIFVELKHLKTGARYIHLVNEDKNNVFCVAFKTVPKDSSGVAHILEHTVLTGSKKYPVRDPFFSMYKRSLKTFMNAFTSGDWTAYPFATQNEKDFMNLLSVYLDASFNPVLSELNFKQEGWRYEFEKDSLVYKGVVYNEMKGSMSSVDRVMSEAQRKGLFENSPYRHNSGGDPDKIIKLKHQDLKDFHQKYYHPSNSFFFSYGSFGLNKTLEYISNTILCNYKKKEIKSAIALEQRWKKPKRAKEFFEVSHKENIRKKYQIAITWLLVDLNNFFEVLSFDILEDILIGNPASPLRKILIESKFGSDLSDESGFNTEFRDTFFSIGLKDVIKEDSKKIKKLIFDCLGTLVEVGIDEEIIKSSLHKLIINKKEISNFPYPNGLSLWLDFIGPWIHGGDPLEVLEIDNSIKRIKNEIKKGRFFEKLIKKYFLENKHYIHLDLIPKKKLFLASEKKTAKKLFLKQKSLSVIKCEKIKKQTKELLSLQEKQENLDCLPTVKIDDVKKDYKKINKRKLKNIVIYEKETRGLIYFSIKYKLDKISKEYLPYLPIFCYILNKIGTKKKSATELIRSVEMNTGGIVFRATVNQNIKKLNKPIMFLSIEAKCLKKNSERCLKLIQEIISSYNFKDLDLIVSYLREKQAALGNAIVESGHVFASMLAASNINKTSKINEMWNGIEQFLWLKGVNENLDNAKLEKIREHFLNIADDVFSRQVFKVAVVGEKNLIKKIFPKLNFVSKKSRATLKKNNEIVKLDKVYKQGIAIPSQVSYVAGIVKTTSINNKDAAPLLVLTKLLGLGYLHGEIREKGGAYGAYLRYDYMGGYFIFLSYRDPHVYRTLKVFLGSRNFLENKEINKKDVDEAILQVISEIDKPLAPQEKAQNDFAQELLGISYRLRKEFRKNVLLVTKNDIKLVADKYLPKKMEDFYVGVIASEEKLGSFAKKLKNKKLKIRKI